jgi:glycine/D-amino acid oxidase-like deaminating enzyme
MQRGIAMHTDVVVIGGGLVGSAIAYGLAGRKLKVLVLDGGDRDFRASTANMGLVWQQGKGMDMPAYQQLTRDSVSGWPQLSSDLMEATSIDVQYENKGGLTVCLGEAEFAARRAKLQRLDDQLGSNPHWEMLDRAALTKLLPGVPLGPEVAGASFGCRDGHANPLRLLSALHTGVVRKGGQLRGGVTVCSVRREGSEAFRIELGSSERVSAARVLIAAGLGSKVLASQVGLNIPIRPQRGQLLVTERLEPLLPLPLHSLRQTRDGTVMIGVTNENTGYDNSTTAAAAAALSAKVLRWLPALSDAKLVRQWAGLRIMTPDTYPIYAQSQSHPGAFVAVCHSGVTLAAAHAGLLADAIAAGRLTPSLDAFHERRFDVSKAA